MTEVYFVPPSYPPFLSKRMIFTFLFPASVLSTEVVPNMIAENETAYTLSLLHPHTMYTLLPYSIYIFHHKQK